MPENVLTLVIKTKNTQGLAGIKETSDAVVRLVKDVEAQGTATFTKVASAAKASSSKVRNTMGDMAREVASLQTFMYRQAQSESKSAARAQEADAKAISKSQMAQSKETARSLVADARLITRERTLAAKDAAALEQFSYRQATVEARQAKQDQSANAAAIARERAVHAKEAAAVETFAYRQVVAEAKEAAQEQERTERELTAVYQRESKARVAAEREAETLIASARRAGAADASRSIGMMFAGQKAGADEPFKRAARLSAIGTGLSMAGMGATNSFTLPMAGAVVGGLGASISRESSFTDVKKLYGNSSASDLAAINAEMVKLTHTIPVTYKELSQYGSLGGQLGVPIKALGKFDEVVKELGMTTDATGEEAATGLAKIAAAFGISDDQFSSYLQHSGSALAQMSKEGSSTTSTILDMSMRFASAAKTAKMTIPDILALANAVGSMGQEAEAGGSAVQRIIAQMEVATATGGKSLKQFANVAGMSTGQFKTLFERDAFGAIMTFVQGLARLEAQGHSSIQVLQGMGIHNVQLRQTILNLATGFEKAATLREHANKAFADGNVLTQTAAIVTASTGSQLRILGNEVEETGKAFGDSLVPTLRQLMPAFHDMLETCKSLLVAFGKLPRGIQETVMVVIALGVALGPVLTGLGSFISLLGGSARALETLIVWLGRTKVATAELAVAEEGAAAAGVTAFGPASLLVAALVGLGFEISSLVDKYHEMTAAQAEAAAGAKAFSDKQKGLVNSGGKDALIGRQSVISEERAKLDDQIKAQEAQRSLIASFEKRSDPLDADNLRGDMQTQTEKFGDTTHGGLDRMKAQLAKLNAEYDGITAKLHKMKTIGGASSNIAKIVYSVGKQMGVSDKQMLAAFETGLVESGMKNIAYGDRDSLGVFQQRPSQGWGSKSQVMDPSYAARKFFQAASKIDDTHLTPGQLAQKVQRSAFPLRYDQRQSEASSLLSSVQGAPVSITPAGRPASGSSLFNPSLFGSPHKKTAEERHAEKLAALTQREGDVDTLMTGGKYEAARQKADEFYKRDIAAGMNRAQAKEILTHRLEDIANHQSVDEQAHLSGEIAHYQKKWSLHATDNASFQTYLQTQGRLLDAFISKHADWLSKHDSQATKLKGIQERITGSLEAVNEKIAKASALDADIQQQMQNNDLNGPHRFAASKTAIEHQHNEQIRQGADKRLADQLYQQNLANWQTAFDVYTNEQADKRVENEVTHHKRSAQDALSYYQKRQSDLEAAGMAYTDEWYKIDAAVTQITANISQTQKQIAEDERQFVEEKLNAIKELFGKGGLNASEYTAKLKDLDAEIAKFEADHATDSPKSAGVLEGVRHATNDAINSADQSTVASKFSDIKTRLKYRGNDDSLGIDKNKALTDLQELLPLAVDKSGLQNQIKKAIAELSNPFDSEFQKFWKSFAEPADNAIKGVFDNIFLGKGKRKSGRQILSGFLEGEGNALIGKGEGKISDIFQGALFGANGKGNPLDGLFGRKHGGATDNAMGADFGSTLVGGLFSGKGSDGKAGEAVKTVKPAFKDAKKSMLEGAMSVMSAAQALSNAMQPHGKKGGLFGAIIGGVIGAYSGDWMGGMGAGAQIGGMLGFADGGVPPVGFPSLVGERGPELFIPRVPGTIIPNHGLNLNPSDYTNKGHGYSNAPSLVQNNNYHGDIHREVDMEEFRRNQGRDIEQSFRASVPG